MALAVELKETSEAKDGYRGIRLELEYSPGTKEAAISLHAILTGEKMPSEEILTALHTEAEILIRCGKEFELMVGQMEGQEYHAVNHRYVSLYYFTASASSTSAAS